MQNVLFRLHQAVKDSPEPEGEGTETEAFARMLAEQAFWAESQDQESGGQIGLAFTQGEDDEEPLLLVYMRDDGGHEAPATVAEEIASGEREYTWLPGAFLLGLSRKIDFTLCIIGEDGQTLPLNSQFMKMMFLYIQELYREDDEGETAAQSPSAPVSPHSDNIVETPGSAGKVIGFLILAAAIVAVVYFMQT
ncbi:hypothetical protein Q4R91_09265 [Morganella morganii]|uniref:hypothetical protein n=1 Tax=Morganella morganii TaxID=582 RepID=UPI0031AA0454